MMTTWIDRGRRRLRRLHHDQRGTLSIVSVFALLVLTLLLAMVINVARHADDKLRMQIAADAAAHSGGVVLARGMNAVAFSNHLLCDVFAITAFLREGEQRNAESFTPLTLEAWEIVGGLLSDASFQKFADAGPVIGAKVLAEREAIKAFGEMTALAADLTLPVFEYILEEELIPQYQRELVVAVPSFAQNITQAVAERHQLPADVTLSGYDRPVELPGPSRGVRGMQTGRLWRTNGMLTGYPDEEDPLLRTLPIVDPAPGGMDDGALLDEFLYRSESLRMRRRLAKFYLDRWNFEKLGVLFRAAKMSQFANLWRVATCGHLDRLLTLEYPLSNMPMIIRLESSGLALAELLRDGKYAQYNDTLERDFTFVATVHRERLPETAPGVFVNPQSADALTFAQAALFVPRPRWITGSPLLSNASTVPLGGTFGFDSQAEIELFDGQDSSTPSPSHWRVESWPARWDSFNQNWTAKLVPATASAIPMILQTNPGGDVAGLRMPVLGDADMEVIQQVNTH